MSKVFKVWPKRVKRVNGTVLTPEMDIVVTTKMSVSNPFYNNAQEVKEAYMRLYQFDYKNSDTFCFNIQFNFLRHFSFPFQIKAEEKNLPCFKL